MAEVITHTCDHCKRQATPHYRLRVYVGSQPRRIAEETPSELAVHVPVDLCIECLGGMVEEQRKALPAEGNRAWVTRLGLTVPGGLER